MSVQFSGVARINYFTDDNRDVDNGLKKFAQGQVVKQLSDQGMDYFQMFESAGDDYVAYNTKKSDHPGRLAETQGTEMAFELEQCKKLLPKDFSKTDADNIAELDCALGAIREAYARFADQNKNTVNVFIRNLQPSEFVNGVPIQPPIHHVKVEQLKLDELRT